VQIGGYTSTYFYSKSVKMVLYVTSCGFGEDWEESGSFGRLARTFLEELALAFQGAAPMLPGRFRC
jgi:hypothetical protein